MPDEIPANPEDHLGSMSAAEKEHLWQHGLHEDNDLIQRGNFFLIAESMLVVAFAALLTVSDKSQSARLAGTVVAVFGLLLTVAWTYVGHRHWTYVKYLQKLALQQIAYYRMVRAGRPRNPLPTTAVMTWIVPALAGVMWILLIFMV